MENVKSPLLTRAEAAEYLRLSTSMLDKLSRQGKIPRTLMGTRVLYSVEDLQTYCLECREAGTSASSRDITGQLRE